MNPKYEILDSGAIRAPFETEAEVAVYRLEHSDAIAAYNASQAASQPVSRDTPTKLGAILLGLEEPEPQTEFSPMVSMLFGGNATELVRTMKSIRASTAFA